LFFEGSVSPYAYNEIATQAFGGYIAECPDVIRNGFSVLVDWQNDASKYPIIQ
jgi:hypothetical protein